MWYKTKRAQPVLSQISDTEIIDTPDIGVSVASTSRGRPKPRPAYKGRETLQASDAQSVLSDDDEIMEVAPQPKSRSTKDEPINAKRKRRKLDDNPESAVEDDRSAIDRKGKRKTKPAGESRPKQGIDVHVDEEDDGGDPHQHPQSSVLKPRNRGRGGSAKPPSKASVAKGKATARSSAKSSKQSRKDSSVERSRGEGTAGSDVNTPPKKKKRKIFPTANTAAFAWDSLGQVSEPLHLRRFIIYIFDSFMFADRWRTQYSDCAVACQGWRYSASKKSEYSGWLWVNIWDFEGPLMILVHHCVL